MKLIQKEGFYGAIEVVLFHFEEIVVRKVSQLGITVDHKFTIELAHIGLLGRKTRCEDAIEFTVFFHLGEKRGFIQCLECLPRFIQQ